jgi:nitrite reductase (NADH) small subunit
MSELAMTITTPTWVAICKVTDIPTQGSRVIQREGKPNIAIFKTISGKVFALLDECPHKKGPLSQGIVHGDQVTCPLHAWNIELTNGSAVAPDTGCTQHFAVTLKMIDDHLWVHLEAEALDGSQNF